jgi:predicted metalloprotease with PDZ domain
MDLFNTSPLKILIFIFLLSLIPSGQLRARPVLDSTSYSVRINKDNIKKAIVESMVQVEDSSLFMSSVGANQFPDRWATFVHELKATTPEGEPVKLESLSGAKWKVHASNGAYVKLHYEVHLNHEDHKWSGGVDGAAYARQWGVFYTGRSIFIMTGKENKGIKVRFYLPENWKVSSPWNIIENQRNTYFVENLTSLADSMFFAGTHEEIILKRDDFELIFALGGDEIIEQKESFSKMAAGVLDYYIDLMQGVPNPSPDNKFNKSIVVINSASKTDGEVIGNNISILLEKDGDEMSELIGRFIFAHEFFHLWSGKSFAPVNDDCEWFKEGFANYYTLKSLFHIGYLNKESYLNVLNDFFYQRYITDEGTGKLSMVDGALKHDHWGLIYSGGFFIGISQDMIIRSSTVNKNSIDDVMRTLFKKYGGTNDGYTLSELKELMSETSGKDQTTFFKTYVQGVTKIPLDHYLKMGGFHAIEENGKLSVSLKKDADTTEKQISDGLFGIK